MSIELIDGEYVQAMEKEGRYQVETAIAWFKEEGVDVPRTPVIRYWDNALNLLPPTAVAGCPMDVESAKRIISIIGKTRMQSIHRYFGLNVSEEALDENIRVLQSQVENEIQTYLPNDADIFLFPPAVSQVGMPGFLEAIAHELWHLVEKEKGVLADNGLTHEGTATYVGQRRIGYVPIKREYASVHDFLYSSSAQVVRETVGHLKNPLPSLLEPDIRNTIGNRIQSEVFPQLKNATLQSGAQIVQRMRGAARAHMLNDKCMQTFRETKTATALLLGWKLQGYTRLSEELEHQDTSKLLAYYVSVLEEETDQH